MKWIYININELTDNQYESFTKFVSKERRQRLKRYKYIDDAKRSLLAALLVRAELVQQLQCTNDELLFAKNDYGKSICLNREDAHFNVAHSGDYVVAAFSKKPIGIDIEKHKEINVLNFHSVLNEWEYQEICRSNHPIATFYKFWTAKESYTKALGIGLTYPVKDIRVLSNGAVKKSHLLTPWHISQYFSETYTVSICMKDKYENKKGKGISIQNLKTFLEGNE